jgi:hypothetical protein
MREERVGTPKDFTTMTADQVKEVYKARPFRAFSLHLADGDTIHVKSPEFMWMTPGGRTIFVSQGGESAAIIDLLLVTKISFLNGRKPLRRRRSSEG